MLSQINVRFFTYAYLSEDAEKATDYVEITEASFKKLAALDGSDVSYERHTIAENGCRQVCLTVCAEDWPEVEELELYQEKK